MQEQERIANEEAEKRLKAALTAKREPGATVSRVASPAIGNAAASEIPEVKPVVADEVEVPMEVDSTPPAAPPKEEVSFSPIIWTRSLELQLFFFFCRVHGYPNSLHYLRTLRQ